MPLKTEGELTEPVSDEFAIVRAKSEAAPTVSRRGWFFVGPPGAEALIVICEVPAGVIVAVAIDRLIVTGFPAVGVTRLVG